MRRKQDRTRRLRRSAVVAAAVGLVLAIGAAPALACGGLIGENGTIELVRTTTLAAYTDGVERYVTAFEFTGEGEEVGSIIPLPDIPTKVERGGDWTLQRLALEVAPPQPEALRLSADDSASGEAEVILEVEIDALDITVLRGGGDAVGQWAAEHGFLLTPDAPEILDFYAERSPVFMAARFNAERAADLGQQAGDSTPIMATIPTDDPWVPVRILGLGAAADDRIEADVFVLTDDKPSLLAGGTGLTLMRSERAGDLLLDDLRSDVGMEWLPDDMWFSYLQLGVPGRRAGLRPGDLGNTGRLRRLRRHGCPRTAGAAGGRRRRPRPLATARRYRRRVPFLRRRPRLGTARRPGPLGRAARNDRRPLPTPARLGGLGHPSPDRRRGNRTADGRC